ncbi:MAG: 4'-phosphopantetheinyl transferase family protein [Erythrobacter sp.]
MSSAPVTAHVWLDRPLEGDAWFADLSDAERQRAAGLRFARDRNSYVAAHGLLRRALSERVPEVAPSQWQFVSDAVGRPELAAPFRDTGLRFSLSHAPGAVACVVTQEAACGIDVESLTREINVFALAKRTASATEREALQALPVADRGALFLRLWTLKEAYAKAIGSGLSTPFDVLSFDLADGIALRSTSDAHALDEFGFAQWTTGDGHVVAVAAAADGDRPLRVVLHGQDERPAVARDGEPVTRASRPA